MTQALNYQASGNGSEIDGEIARRFVAPEENLEAVAFKQALRDFIKKVMESYGKDSTISIMSDGTMDHGGGNMQLSMSILNYGAGGLSEKVVTAGNTNSDKAGELAGKPADTKTPITEKVESDIGKPAGQVESVKASDIAPPPPIGA